MPHLFVRCLSIRFRSSWLSLVFSGSLLFFLWYNISLKIGKVKKKLNYFCLETIVFVGLITSEIVIFKIFAIIFLTFGGSTIKLPIEMRRLYLKRFSKTTDGTWGVFCSDDQKPLFFTAEIPNTFLRPGVYRCKLQTHFQANGKAYPAYEITGVEGHKDVEIHIGNVPTLNSKGCVLLGMQAGVGENGPLKGKWGVWQSTYAHYDLLDYLKHAPEFYLEITEQA